MIELDYSICSLKLILCFSVSQEAISTGNPELVSLTLQYRDFQRGSQRLAGIPELLDDLNSVCIFILLFIPVDIEIRLF